MTGFTVVQSIVHKQKREQTTIVENNRKSVFQE